MTRRSQARMKYECDRSPRSPTTGNRRHSSAPQARRRRGRSWQTQQSARVLCAAQPQAKLGDPTDRGSLTREPRVRVSPANTLPDSGQAGRKDYPWPVCVRVRLLAECARSVEAELHSVGIRAAAAVCRYTEPLPRHLPLASVDTQPWTVPAFIREHELYLSGGQRLRARTSGPYDWLCTCVLS